jgi:hypothetical protein
VTIVELERNRVVIKEPLLHDLRPEWHPVVARWSHLEEVGIEHFRFEFPRRAYAGHHLADGYNAVYLTGLAHSWARDLTIHNADNGILAEESTNLTIDNILVTGRLRHYSVSLGSVHNVLAQNIISKGPVLHAISFNTRARRNVFSGVRLLDDPSLDMHSGANQQNLFENIEARITNKKYSIWKNAGPSYWKPNHGPFTTFWNIKLDFDFHHPPGKLVALAGIQDSPEARIIGVFGNYPVKIEYGKSPYMECNNQGALAVKSLYQYQLERRLAK